MKLELKKKEPSIEPVTITLETQAEINTLHAIFNRIGGHVRAVAARQLTNQILFFLEDYIKYDQGNELHEGDRNVIHFNEGSNDILGFTTATNHLRKL